MHKVLPRSHAPMRPCARAPVPPCPHAPVRSFTLIELLVVISVIGFLLGISTATYFAFLRTTALEGDLNAVAAILETARSSACSQRSETFVRIDAANGTILPFRSEKVAVWHFEALDETVSPPLTHGALGQVAYASGAGAKLAAGTVGNALLFDGAYHLKCKLPRAGGPVNIPTYDAREGLVIEADVAPLRAAGSGRLTVLWRDGWFGMSLRYDEPAGRFALETFAVTLDPDGTDCLRWTAATLPVIRAGEWTRVSMSGHKFGEGLVLAVNGVVQDLASSAAESASAPAATAETTIGATATGADPFHGRIDGLVLAAYAVDAAHKVNGRVTLVAENLADGNTIRFDASGALASAHEGNPPRVFLRQYKGSQIIAEASVTVGPMGALDVAEPWYK